MKDHTLNKEKSLIDDDFSNELGFLFINDKVKNDSLAISDELQQKSKQNELKVIKDSLGTIQQHLNQLEKSIVKKRNNDESNRRNQINSNYMLMSNLEKTNMISKNLNSFQNQFFDNFTINFNASIQQNIKNLSLQNF